MTESTSSLLDFKGACFKVLALHFALFVLGLFFSLPCTAEVSPFVFHQNHYTHSETVQAILTTYQNAKQDPKQLEKAFFLFQNLKNERLKAYQSSQKRFDSFQKVISLSQISAALDQETVVVEFLEYKLPSDTWQYRYLVCYVSHDSVSMYEEMMPLAVFEHQKAQFQETMSYPDYLFYGKHLYMRLYKRIGKALRGMKAFICPDLLMSELPHHALLHAIPADNQLFSYSALSYTAKITQIHYALNSHEAWRLLKQTQVRRLPIVKSDSLLSEPALYFIQNSKKNTKRLFEGLLWAKQNPNSSCFFSSPDTPPRILEDFQQQLQKGLPLYLAWHYALKFYLESTQVLDKEKHIDYWASSYLVGNVSPLRVTNLPEMLWWHKYNNALWTLCLVFLTFLVKYFWKKCQRD